jgi:hypothetical protein
MVSFVETRELVRRRPVLACLTVLACLAVLAVLAVLVAGATRSTGEPALAATDQALGWQPPLSTVYSGKEYPLLTGQGALVASSRAAMSAYVDAAWCGPVLAGRPPGRSSVAALFAPGSPGAKRASSQALTQVAPDNPAGIAAQPVFAPVPGPVTRPMCNWVSNFPRIATTGAFVTPQMAGQKIPAHRLVYPALYGSVTSVAMPTFVELSYRSASGDAHVFVAGTLTLAPRQGALVPTDWTITAYWSRPDAVAAPSFLVTDHHWNEHGSLLGPHLKEPSDAATLS